MNNFITNSDKTISLKSRLQKLISASDEHKFLVGFFYFSGCQEIFTSLQKNDKLILKILVGLQVEKHLSRMLETEERSADLSNEEHCSKFMKSLGYAINNAEMDNEKFYDQEFFFIENFYIPTV